MTGAPVILTEHLTRRFGDTVAVDDLDLEIHRGEVFGFLGHPGAGKTTTVRLLNGVLGASAGTAWVLGLSPSSDGVLLRQRTGVLTGSPSLDLRLEARTGLELHGALYGIPRPALRARVDEVLALMGLEGHGSEVAGRFSPGMRLRLALARALLHRPEILFLDEPTGGLDPAGQREVHPLLRRLAQETACTVFLCTHDLVEAAALCDRVGVMERGRLVALGAPRELAAALGHGARLELEVDPRRIASARMALAQLDGLTAEEGAPGVLLVKGAARARVPVLLRALLVAGVPVYRASPVEASLADVYLALHDGPRAGERVEAPSGGRR